MEQIELQQIFFREIKAKVPANISFADALADLLNISTDSAYRRIRGEKPLSFDEIRKICKEYRVSLDKMMNLGGGDALFQWKMIDAERFTFDQYLEEVYGQTERICKGTNKMLTYEAKDFPLFHYFNFPRLAAFKTFFWKRTTLAYGQLAGTTFEDYSANIYSNATGSGIIKNYNQFPSTEIWSNETINSTLSQIRYYHETGVFENKASIAELISDLKSMLNHIKYEAEQGEKLLPGQRPLGNKNYFLYYNEVYLGHNTILLEVDTLKAVYINHGILNFMHTTDPDFYERSRNYFNNTIGKSSLISSQNEKERNRFFNNLSLRASKLLEELA